MNSLKRGSRRKMISPRAAPSPPLKGSETSGHCPTLQRAKTYIKSKQHCPAYLQTGCSGLAPAPELLDSGCRNLALRAFVNKPRRSSIRDLQDAKVQKRGLSDPCKSVLSVVLTKI